MSVCTFIASDVPLPEAVPSREYPLEIDIDSGTIYDGGADDNYVLNTFADAADYTDKKTVFIDDVTEKMLEEVDSAPVWNRPDKMYPDRPSFYCLTITK